MRLEYAISSLACLGSGRAGSGAVVDLIVIGAYRRIDAGLAAHAAKPAPTPGYSRRHPISVRSGSASISGRTR